MHIQTHLMASWAIGSRLENSRDRRIVAWSGVAADLDGLSVFWGAEAYGRWHHVLAHGLVAAGVVAMLASSFGRERRKVAVLALITFHLHLVLDVLGSGRGWTIAYFYPFSSREFGVLWGWELASWQNVSATLLLLGFSMHSAIAYGRSFVETWMPTVVDQAFCKLAAETWRKIRSLAQV